MSRYGRDLAVLGLLAILPVAALAPAWTQGLLLGPGDGAALHFPLRVAAWRALAAGEVPSWNPGIFFGAPLLASYRAAALHPFTLALSLMPEFTAFQVLVLGSLSLAATLLYVYVRGLGATRPAAFASGLLFSLGPLFLGRLGDTATLAAAPMTLLVLISLERLLSRAGPASEGLLAGAVALVLYSGSPEASWATVALVLGRLGFRRFSPGPGARHEVRRVLVASGCGMLLAAPQLVPTGLALLEAGPGTSGWADSGSALPGLAGLLVRYVSHTPAPVFAFGALPLLHLRAVRGFTLALALALPASLAVPGVGGRAAAVVADLALCVVASLVLSEHDAARAETRGRRLRAYVLVAALGAAAALSVATTLTGPLPDLLAGAVGVLALAFILFLAFGGSPSFVKAHVFLLPLTVSMLLQPHGRAVWAGAPTEAEVFSGTLTRRALDRAMLPRREERVLSLVRAWPHTASLDLGYAGLGAVAGRRDAGGYDPLVPRIRRRALDGMSEAGTLAPAFLRTDPGRLDFLGVRFVQVASSDLTVSADANGLGENLDVVVDPARPRYFPLPITATTEVRIESSLSDSVLTPQGVAVALLTLRLASGRTLPLPLRAGVDTAEWAFDRTDVTPLMRHEKAKVIETFAAPGAAYQGLRYLARLRLQGRYLVDGVFVEGLPGGGRLSLFKMGLLDAVTGRATGVSASSAYLSDSLRFREAAATPLVRLLELRGSLGRGRVVDGLRLRSSEEEVLADLREPFTRGLDPRREALANLEDARGLVLPQGARTSRAVVARSSPSTLELRAEGPGLLVVTEGWDPGWSARVDAEPARIFRVNATLMGVVLEGGAHRVALVHHARGLLAGAALCALGVAALLARWMRSRR